MDVSHHPLTSTPKTGAASVRIQMVILAGGAGTRLWPLSRQQFPKQLIELVGADNEGYQAMFDREFGIKIKL